MEKSLAFIYVLIVIAYGCPSQVTVNEGDVANINLQFSYAEFEITLKFVGEFKPFYNKGIFVESELAEYDRLKRYSISKFVLQANKSWNINFVITNVRRQDAKDIECDIYVNGEKEDTLMTKIGVKFPPSVTSCTSTDQSDSEYPSVMLNCTAFRGNIPANILCYQYDKMVPLISEPMTQNETHMNRKVLVTKTALAFCCSSTLKDPLDMHRCNDFKWEPQTYPRDEHSNYKNTTPTPSPDSATLPPTCNITENPHIESIKTALIVLTSVICFMSALLIICVVYVLYITHVKLTTRTPNISG